MARTVRVYRAAVVLLTAALLATLTAALTGGERASAVEGPVEIVYVATGQNFPDALAGANLAATVGAPMLTVNPGLPIPDATITALEALDPNQIIILGGPVAVSDAVKGALGDYTRSGAVTRIEGGDRHDTAAKIADALPSKVHDADLLDGLDSSAFVRQSQISELGQVFGSRDQSPTTPTTKSSSAAFDTVHELTFEAATDGIAFVTGKVLVINTDDGNPADVGTRLLLDWDGNVATATTDHGIDVGRMVLHRSPDPGHVGTLSMTAAVPVAAGTHTITMLIIGPGGTTEWAAEGIAVAVAPSGTATDPGYNP